MCVTFSVHIVQSVHHLMEIGPGNNLREFSCVGNEIEQLTSSNVLQYNCKTFICRFILFFIGGVFSDIDQAHQVFVIQIFHNTELMLKNCEVSCFLFILFYRHLIALFVLTEFDLCMITGTKGLDDLVLI